MENIVQKIYDFILFLVNTIKSFVMNVSGKDDKTPFFPEATTESK